VRRREYRRWKNDDGEREWSSGRGGGMRMKGDGRRYGWWRDEGDKARHINFVGLSKQHMHQLA